MPIFPFKITALVLVGFALCNWNLTYRFAYDSDRIASGPIVNYDEFLADPFNEYQAAGFPMMHYLRIGDTGFPDFTVFYWRPFLGNIAIWLCFLYVVIRCDRSIERRRKGGKLQLYLSDLLMIVVAVAAGLSAWRFAEFRSNEELKLSRAILDRGGSMVRSLWLPENAIGRMAVSFNRTRGIQIVIKNADDAILKRTLNIDRLTSLCLDGGNYDLRLLSKLVQKPFLRELRVSGRALSPEMLNAVGETKQLNSLNLMDTNLTDDDLQKISNLPRLKYLNLLQTGIRPSSIASLTLADQLKGIVLPNPENGEFNPIRVDGWPRLKYFVCNSIRPLSSKTVASIELKNLPRLSKVFVDCLQPIDLELTNLPNLSAIEAIHIDEDTRRSLGGLRARNVVLNSVKNLKSLKLHVADLERIELHESNLDSLAILEDGMEADVTVGDRMKHNARPPRLLNSLHPMVLKGLKESTGPKQLEIYADLSRASLDPVFQNQSIKVFDLSRAVVTSEQLRRWKGLANAADIRLGDVDISNGVKHLPWLEQDLPGLANELSKGNHDRYAGRIVGQLNIENDDSITSLRLGRNGGARSSLSIDSLRLIHVTKLSDTISVQTELRSLIVDDAPSIRGLRFAQPIPMGTKLSGLRDLTEFHASGDHFTDDLLAAVLECPNLRELSIGDSSVSSEALYRISSLKKLQILMLQGSQLDENVLGAIASIPTLTNLVLRNATLNAESIDALIGASTNGRMTLFLDHCEVQKALVLKLAEKRPSIIVVTAPHMEELQNLYPSPITSAFGGSSSR